MSKAKIETTTLPDGTIMSGFIPEHIFGGIKRRKEYYEIKLLNYMAKLLKKQKFNSIIDCGANIGNHSLFLSKHFPKKTIFAYEPFDEVFDILSINIAQNNLAGTIIPRKIGLSDKPGYLKVSDYREKNLGATAFVESEKETNFLSTTMDQEKYNGRIGLIKMDIQGAELKALNGGVNTIRSHKPIIICEADTDQRFMEIDEFLKRFGYRWLSEDYRKYSVSTPTYIWTLP